MEASTETSKGLLFGALGLSLFFYQLKQRDTPVLLAGILVSLWGYVAYQAFVSRTETAATNATKEVESLTTLPVETMSETALPLREWDAQFIPKKGLRYLKKNPTLLEILRDLQFVKRYDAPRLHHLALLMDRFQKAYIYMLVQRYRISEGMSIFYDLNESIQETLYSFAVNVPVVLRHTYGLQPHERLQANIATFQGLFRTMVEILRNFAVMELKAPYFPEWTPTPGGLPRIEARKNVLP